MKTLTESIPSVREALQEAHDFLNALLGDTPDRATDLLTNSGEDVNDRLYAALHRSPDLTTVLADVELRLTQATLASSIVSPKKRVDFLLGEMSRMKDVVRAALAKNNPKKI